MIFALSKNIKVFFLFLVYEISLGILMLVLWRPNRLLFNPSRSRFHSPSMLWVYLNCLFHLDLAFIAHTYQEVYLFLLEFPLWEGYRFLSYVFMILWVFSVSVWLIWHVNFFKEPNLHFIDSFLFYWFYPWLGLSIYYLECCFILFCLGLQTHHYFISLRSL